MDPQIRPLPLHERAASPPPAKSPTLYWVIAAAGVVVLLAALAYFSGLVGKGAKGGNAPADTSEKSH